MTSHSLARRPVSQAASDDRARRRPRGRDRRVLLPVALLVGVPLLAGCGGDDTSAVDAATGVASADAGQQAPGRDGAGFPGASGLVADVSGSTAQVQGSAGQVAVSWTGATTFTREVTGSLDDVVVGSCLVATVADDVAVSLRITEASDDGCTAGLGAGPGAGFGGGPGDEVSEGERPEGMPSDVPSGAPADDGQGERPEGMPDGFGAAVIGEVVAVSGGTVTVAAVELGPDSAGDDGATVEQELDVDADSEVMTTVSATADDVAEGSCLTARGEVDDLGAVTAESVALSEPVDGSCTTGPGGFGRGPGVPAGDAEGDS